MLPENQVAFQACLQSKEFILQHWFLKHTLEVEHSLIISELLMLYIYKNHLF